MFLFSRVSCYENKKFQFLSFYFIYLTFAYIVDGQCCVRFRCTAIRNHGAWFPVFFSAPQHTVCIRQVLDALSVDLLVCCNGFWLRVSMDWSLYTVICFILNTAGFWLLSNKKFCLWYASSGDCVRGRDHSRCVWRQMKCVWHVCKLTGLEIICQKDHLKPSLQFFWRIDRNTSLWSRQKADRTGWNLKEKWCGSTAREGET